MEKQEDSLIQNKDSSSLESQETLIEPTISPGAESGGVITPGSPGKSAYTPPEQQGQKSAGLKNFWRSVSIYFLAFIFIVLIGMAFVAVVIFSAKKNSTSTITSSQSLSQSQFEKLAGSAQTVGNSNQVLNIDANTIFKNQVLVQKDLDVAGNIKIGGSLDLPGISVAGGAKFAQINTNKLSVSGATTLQGQLTSSSGLVIAGASTFSSSVSVNKLTVQNLQLSGVLSLNNHIQAGGSSPSRVTGSAVGSGGTTSLNGSDTSGSVSINTGSSPGAGCFITVNFASRFNSTPHVIITPIGSYAAGLNYYVNRSTSNFSICSTTAASGGHSFGFDYLVLD